MYDDYTFVSLGLVPRKSLGVQYYSVALLVPTTTSDPVVDDTSIEDWPAF